MKEKELYELECHQILHDVDIPVNAKTDAEGSFTVIRVPGGWIYTHWKQGKHQPVFVPFCNEFNPFAKSPNAD